MTNEEILEYIKRKHIEGFTANQLSRMFNYRMSDIVEYLKYINSYYKRCRKCNERKLYTEFTIDNSRSDKLKYWCKECTLIDVHRYRSENSEKYKNYYKNYFQETKEHHKENIMKWKKEHPEEFKIIYNRYRDKNPEYMSFKNSKYRTQRKHAMPHWVDMSEIRKIYKQARELEKLDGVKRNVDHIIPIQGENVCGLHVPWNLQILTESENLKKGNRLIL